MSPVTTPPGSAATPIPSGVKVKYRYGNKDMDDVHDNMGVKLDLDDYGAGFSFKRPLDIVMENATNGDNSGSSQHSSENEYRNNSRKFARIDSGTEGNLSAAVNEIVKSSPSKSSE